MNRRRTKRPALKQPTPPEVVESLLSFIQTHFYKGHAVAFEKDRPRLLEWVVFYPAKEMNKQGVTVPASRYDEIVRKVLMTAVRFGDLEKVTYFPAYLLKAMQSHFFHHGEAIYEEAKSTRNLVEHALLFVGQHAKPAAEPDIVDELVKARRLLRATRFKKATVKDPVKAQLSLL